MYNNINSILINKKLINQKMYNNINSIIPIIRIRIEEAKHTNDYTFYLFSRVCSTFFSSVVPIHLSGGTQRSLCRCSASFCLCFIQHSFLHSVCFSLSLSTSLFLSLSLSFSFVTSSSLKQLSSKKSCMLLPGSW